MRKLATVLVPLLVLALIVGGIGCDGGGEALSPEAREIRDFLNDKHVNAVLWEEWNLFDEWAYVLSLYENSPQSGEDWNRLWQQEKALATGARQNHQDLLAISAPHSLQAFWDDMSAWPKQFYEWSNGVSTPFSAWQLERASRKHAEAWLELRGICREQGINMEWPLPRQLPSSVGGGSGMPPIPGGGGGNGGMPPIPGSGGGGGGGMPPIPVR